MPHLVLLAAVAVVVAAVDQVTKTMALENLPGRSIHLFWTLRLNLEFNTGGAFGLGRAFGPFFVAAGVVLLVLLLFVAHRVRDRLMAITLGLVLGGAVGNLTDRLVRHHAGAVVDFIDLQWWPVFNVADAAISCGAVLLLLASRRDTI